VQSRATSKSSFVNDNRVKEAAVTEGDLLCLGFLPSRHVSDPFTGPSSSVIGSTVAYECHATTGVMTSKRRLLLAAAAERLVHSPTKTPNSR
jgi:hypothetical protein